MLERITNDENEVLQVLIQTWNSYADITQECAPAASEAYRRCARQLEQALQGAPEAYPLPL